MRELAEEELRDLEERSERLQQELRLMLLPKDPNDERDVIVEIRAGTGGEEAALFAGELLRMYTRYAEQQGWKAEMLSATPSGTTASRRSVLSIKGHGAYSHLKFEGGRTACSACRRPRAAAASTPRRPPSRCCRRSRRSRSRSTERT